MFVNELNKNVCARREQRPTNLFDWAMPSAANFRASERNRTCSYCRAQQKISKKISSLKSATIIQYTIKGRFMSR